MRWLTTAAIKLGRSIADHACAMAFEMASCFRLDDWLELLHLVFESDPSCPIGTPYVHDVACRPLVATFRARRYSSSFSWRNKSDVRIFPFLNEALELVAVFTRFLVALRSQRDPLFRAIQSRLQAVPRLRERGKAEDPFNRLADFGTHVGSRREADPRTPEVARRRTGRT